MEEKQQFLDHEGLVLYHKKMGDRLKFDEDIITANKQKLDTITDGRMQKWDTIPKNGQDGKDGTSAAWFTGTAMSGAGTKSVTVSGAKAGDMYLNTSTYDVYKASSTSSWTYQCNIKGVEGVAGTRGSVWNSGTAMSGTVTTTGYYTYSGASNALVGDKYLNTSNGNWYECTTAGSGSSAKWTYQGCLKGAQGETGAQGPAGADGKDASDTNMEFTQASSRANIVSGEKLSVILGKIMKWFADLTNGGASSLLGSNLTANRALVSNASGKVAVSTVTSTQLGYLSGVTSNVQTQLDGKSNSSHAHSYNDLSDKPSVSKGASSDAVIIGAADNVASTSYSIAGGRYTTASGACSVAIANGATSTYRSEALGDYSAVIGGYFINNLTGQEIGHKANGQCSVVLGGTTTSANGDNSATIGGGSNVADGSYSVVVGGCQNAALMHQVKMGHYSTEGTRGAATGTAGDAFFIGNGGMNSRSNAFRVSYDGNAYAGKAMNSTGADYAEFFEWLDGNPDNEDRRGLFVTLDGNKIRIATHDDDYILGIISAAPGVVGNNHADVWQGMVERDVFGAVKIHTVHHDAEYATTEEVDDETGETITKQVLIYEAYDAEEPEINPEYDPKEKYIPREERPEWGIVGMMGQLVVIDDGTCEVNGYCTVADGGTATATDAGYRVIARLDETHVKVLFR